MYTRYIIKEEVEEANDVVNVDNDKHTRSKRRRGKKDQVYICR